MGVRLKTIDSTQHLQTDVSSIKAFWNRTVSVLYAMNYYDVPVLRGAAVCKSQHLQ